MRNITISVAPSVFARTWTERVISWPAFVNLQTTPIIREKERAPRWCPAKLGGDRSRKLVNFDSADVVVFDFDDGHAYPDRVAHAFAMGCGVGATTFRSTRDAPRVRLVLALDRPVCRSEYDRVWRALAGRCESVGLIPDYSAKDAVHAFVLPSIASQGSDFESFELRGEPISVRDCLAVIPEDRPEERTRMMPIREAAVRDVVRAEKWIATLDRPVEGNRDAQLWRAACGLVRGFELDDATAFNLLADFNATAKPPVEMRALRHKVKEAATKSTLPWGYLKNAPRRATR